MLSFGLGVLTGTVITFALLQLRKIVRKHKINRKYAEYKRKMDALAANPLGWDYVEPTDSPKFRPIKHP